MMRLSRVSVGLINQGKSLAKSNDIEALKEFANDELIDSGSHEWTSKWYPFKDELHRSWKTFSGRHGGSYCIRPCKAVIEPEGL